MNKSLLMLAVAAMSAATASADIITLNAADATDIVAKQDGDNLIDMTSCKIGDYSFTFEAGDDVQASQTPRWWATDKTIRIYKGSKMTVNAPVDMNGIIFSAKKKDACKNFTTATATVDQGTVTVESPNVTWEAATPAKTMTFTLPSETNANFQIQTITIYTGDDKVGSTVTPEPTHATTVAELLNVANKTEFTFEGQLVVAYANGPDCYVYDNTGATLLYSSKDDPWVDVLDPGTIITEFSGTRSDYNTTVEFIPVMNSLVTDGETTVSPAVCKNASEVEAQTVDTYVRLVNVSFTLDEENDRYALATFEDGSSIKIYNRFNGNSYDPKTVYPAAGQYDILGLRSEYKGEAQVNFTSSTTVSSGVAPIAAEEGSSVVYDLQGRPVTGQPAAGLYIVISNGQAQKVIVK